MSKRLLFRAAWHVFCSPSVSSPLCEQRRSSLALRAVLVLGTLLASSASAQSTYGTILGTVKDAAGRAVVGAQIVLTNQGTSAKRTEVTDASGNYTLPNLEQGTYELSIKATGFSEIRNTNIVLTAQANVRVDGSLKVASLAQEVTVVAGAEAVLNTDTSNLAQTKTSLELIQLPVAITSRSTGSTSPMSTLTTQPGVQTDASGNISVAGENPSMLSMTLDGLSSMGTRTGGPLTELFPSFNAIEEIHISEFNNSAEFSGISDITTVSKSGTNHVHGGAYDLWQSDALTAQNPFSLVKPKLNMNDFGGYIGGPLSIPRLYDGHDRTFFFVSYEGLRLPSTTTVVENVPSLALRSGDLSVYSTQIYNPFTGAAFVRNQVPVNAQSANFLTYLFPLPNTGSASSITNNYTNNFPTPVSSDQADARFDQNIGAKQHMFVRGSYKARSVTVAPTASSAVIGSISQPEDDYGLAIAHTYIFTPTVLNEFRVGFNGNHTWTSFNLNAQTIASELGITGLSLPPDEGAPQLNITGFQPVGSLRQTSQSNNNTEVLDDVSWTRGNHDMKFGADYRRTRGNVTNVDAEVRLGAYNFTGAVTNPAQPGTGHPYIGNAYAAFLLGVPDKTGYDSVTQANLLGYSNNYAFFAQDNWRATSRITFNIGLRWEYHPMFQDHLVNVSNFLPNYRSIVNGVPVNGAVVLANQAAFNILNPGFASSIGITPILTAAQAGIPESLRYSDKTDWGPRVGVAWRPFDDNKTVVRGGFGRYMVTPLEGLLSAGFAVHSVDQGIYNQTIVNGQPTLQFPHPFPANYGVPGSQNFNQAFAVHFQDPSVYQWNLTGERDLGYSTSLTVNYMGSTGANLARTENLNAAAPNTLGYAASLQYQPFPVFQQVRAVQNGGVSHYNAVSVAVNRHFSHGVQFQSSYTFTRNLSDAQGYNPTAFVGENGSIQTNVLDPRIDYGNVAFTRRHRFLTTGLWQLPFGRSRAFLANTNGFVDRVISGWELGGVILGQSGPFLTATVPGADPSGTGFAQIIAAGRPDRVNGVAFQSAVRTRTSWFNPAAFATPPNNIGRFGNSRVGIIPGIGTEVVSASFLKTTQIREGLGFQFGTQVANLFNHVNYAQPSTSLVTNTYGVISNVQTAEGAGPRAFQLVFRFTF